MALLEVKQLSKAFGGIKAVNEATFSVEQGTITALIGPNGAGKSTAFKLITGIIKPDAGKVIFNGEEIQGKEPHQVTRRGISHTFQISRNLEDMTVLENMIVQAPVRGMWGMFQDAIPKQEREKAMDILEFIGIAHLANEESRNLSYGQKKLLDFAGLLMTEPKLILLDEPAGGVNPALLENIVAKIQELNSRGMTFLLVEHNMDLVMSVANPVIVMAYGQVIKVGEPRDVQTDHDVLEAYLGELKYEPA